VTLLSCDNLRTNGKRLAAGLHAFLAARGEQALLTWCGTHVTTPDSMVDRITPRPPAALRGRVRAATGWTDGAPVMAEAFRQWVIEDHFAAGRPSLERVGVQFVSDVAPYEEAKIRILNASHSAIAWAGVLKGCEFVHQAVADPAIAALTRAFVSEAAIPCLSPSPIDLATYGANVLARFGNREIADTNQRVASDSCAKLAGFVAPTVTDCLAGRGHLDSAAALPALFLLFMRRWADGALPFFYADQALDPAAMRAILADAEPAEAFCRARRFWHDRAGDPRLTAAVRQALPRVEARLTGN
jgi:D-arabinitol 4-dehydrogenase